MDNLMDGKSYSICFVAYDVSLPSGYYFGFTASNGMYLHDDHDIMSMEISEANPKIKVIRVVFSCVLFIHTLGH